MTGPRPHNQEIKEMVDLPAELGCFVPSSAAGRPPSPTRGHCLCLHVARSPAGRRWGWGLQREVGRTHRAWGHGPRGGGLRQRWGDHGDKPRGCRGAERSGQEELPGRAVHRLSRGWPQEWCQQNRGSALKEGGAAERSLGREDLGGFGTSCRQEVAQQGWLGPSRSSDEAGGRGRCGPGVAG